MFFAKTISTPFLYRKNAILMPFFEKLEKNYIVTVNNNTVNNSLHVNYVLEKMSLLILKKVYNNLAV